VIAGLTVIDPIVAVLIGLVILQEAATAGVWALVGFAIAGVIAIYGVFSLTRNHPQIVSDSQELPILRGKLSDEK
jgi:threonine/homoserine efflux transporter RhtA